MNKTVTVTAIAALTALSTAVLAPSAFAGEKKHHHGHKKECHSTCIGDRDHHRGDDGLLGLDLGGVVNDLLDTVGDIL